MTRDHPVTGVGLENFFVLYPRYRSAESEQFTPDELPTMVHSGYVQAAATTGVPGLLLYLSFLASVSWVIVKAGWRHTDARYRWLALAYVASIAGYLIQDVTGWLEVSLSMYFWTLLGLGVALGAGHARTTWPRGMRAALVAGVGFSSIAVLWLTAGTYETIRCDQLIAGAQRLNVGSEWARIEPALSGASACGSADPIYLDMAGLRYGDRFGATGDRAAYERAAMLFEQAHSSNPFNPYIAIHRISLETAARQKHVITETAPAVRDLVPALLAMDQTNGTVYESVARLRLAEGNVDEAAALVEKAGALRPARGTYRVLDGDVRRARGDRTGAIAAYRRGVDLLRAAGDKDAIAAGHKLIFMLADTGSYQAAADEAHRLIGEAPDDSLAYSLLGIVYQAMNNVPAAREAFVSALRLNPSDVTARNALRQIVERQR
jgi:tetratricopeptide (TPR) repeat protein